MKKQRNFQRHFRKFHTKETSGHPSFVYDEKGNEYKVVGVTSSPRTNGVLNIQLKKNPEPGNTNKAYIRPKPMKINKGVRNTKLKGWTFSSEDKKVVQEVIDLHDRK